MQLEGQVKDLSLPEIFRLLKMGGKTGILKVTAGAQGGDVYFREGQVYYATSLVRGASFGDRLVRAGVLRPDQLVIARSEQQHRHPRPPLGTLLAEMDLVPRAALEAALREQIEETAFDLFNWPEAEFRFIQGEAPGNGDPIVSLDAEGVIMEGSRRVDEWAQMMRAIGSLEKVPVLTPPAAEGKITLRTRDWRVVCFIDGRRDINTIVAESGFDRVTTLRVIFSLVGAGLAAVRDPTLELLGQKVAIAVTGPIDIYNLTFLNTICDTDISNHLRIETVDGEETEVRMSAGVRGVDQESQLFYFCEARTPAAVWRRMAMETSGFIVLVNMNSPDSVLASRRDVALMKDIGDRPYVVAAYASIVDEKVTEAQIRELLDIPSRVPILVSGLRDRDEAATTVDAILQLIP